MEQDFPASVQQIGPIDQRPEIITAAGAAPLDTPVDTRGVQPSNQTIPPEVVQVGAVASTVDKIDGKMVEDPLNQTTIKDDKNLFLKRKLETLNLAANKGEWG